MNDVYEIAWKILDVRLGEKTSWGRNDLKSLMSSCFQQAVDEVRTSTPVYPGKGESRGSATVEGHPINSQA